MEKGAHTLQFAAQSSRGQSIKDGGGSLYTGNNTHWCLSPSLFLPPFQPLPLLLAPKKLVFFISTIVPLCVCAVGSGYGTTDHHCTFELEKERENMGGKGRSSSSSSSSERKSHDKGKRVSQSKQTVFSQSSLQRRPIFFSRTSFDFYGGRTRCPMSKLIDCSRCTPFLCTADILSFISIL